MRPFTLALGMTLSATLSYSYRPSYANAQAMCFWSDTQGELRDLSPMCGKNPDQPDQKGNEQDQSESKPTLVNPSTTGDQPGAKPGATTTVPLKFIPDGRSLTVTGDEEKIGSDGTTFRGNGMITTPDGVNIQMIFKDYKVVGEQIYRADGTPLKPGESMISKAGRTFTQRKF